MSGLRAKMRHFPYIKQNPIAEIVSTMESFLCKGYKKDIFAVLLTGFELSNSITAKPCISSMRSIVYHQNEVLHIIKPQKYTLMRDDIHLR